jgi:CDP-diacylglycerol pyrophosphatase
MVDVNSLTLTRLRKFAAPTLPSARELLDSAQRQAHETPKDTYNKLEFDGEGNIIRRRGDSKRLGRLVDKAEAGLDPGEPVDLHTKEDPDGQDHGYAVIVSKDNPTDLLTVALGDITGIEDPDLYKSDADNYFADAWNDTRVRLAKSLGVDVADLPRDAIALAVNSQNSRSQDRLHIHADLMDPKFREKLKTKLDQGEFGADRWTPVEATEGHQYQATWVAGNNLDKINPFHMVRNKLIADHGGGALGEAYADLFLGQHSITVVGQTDANGREGFLIIVGRAGDRSSPTKPHDSGSAEEWLIGRGGRPA